MQMLLENKNAVIYGAGGAIGGEPGPPARRRVDDAMPRPKTLSDPYLHELQQKEKKHGRKQ